MVVSSSLRQKEMAPDSGKVQVQVSKVEDEGRRRFSWPHAKPKVKIPRFFLFAYSST